MKILQWVLLIPFVVLAYFARMQLWGTFDAEGMPLPLSLASLAMPALLAAAAVVFFLLARRLPAQRELCADMGSYFSFNTITLLGAVGGAFLYVLALALELVGGKAEKLELLAGALLAVGAVCLIAALAALRKEKDFPGVVLLVPVCALVLRVILFYREHTADPFLRDYYVELLALAAMTVFLLEFAAFAFRGGAPRLFVPLGEVCVVLCAAAIAAARLGCLSTADLAFYGGSFFLTLGLLGAADFEP